MTEKTPRETAARIRVLTRAAVGYALSEKPRTLPNVPTSVEVSLSHFDDLANELERESTIADKPVDPTHSRRPSYAQHRRANKPIGVSPEDVQKWLDHINSSESSFDGHTNYRVIESLAIERDQWEVMSQQAAGLAAELRTGLFAMDAELTQVKIDRDRFESLRTNAERHCGVLTARAEKAEGERDRLARELAETKSHLYVPGRWRCPKCNFGLMQMRLRASDGAVGVRDDPGEKCPNCDTPLWRVTEREAGNELADRCAEQIQRAVAAEELLAAANAEIARLKSGGCARGQQDGATQFCAEAARAMADLAAAGKENARLREALEPFAQSFFSDAENKRDEDCFFSSFRGVEPTVHILLGDFRRAALAIRGGGGSAPTVTTPSPGTGAEQDPVQIDDDDDGVERPTPAAVEGQRMLSEYAAARAKRKNATYVNAVGPWYLGCMNDATFIIDGPPRPSPNDDVWHDRPDGPNPVSRAIDDRNGRLIVDAHNATIRQAAEAMRERAGEVADKSRDAEPETNPTMPKMVREQILVARATARDIAAAIRAIPIDAATAKVMGDEQSERAVRELTAERDHLKTIVYAFADDAEFMDVETAAGRKRQLEDGINLFNILAHAFDPPATINSLAGWLIDTYAGAGARDRLSGYYREWLAKDELPKDQGDDYSQC